LKIIADGNNVRAILLVYMSGFALSLATLLHFVVGQSLWSCSSHYVTVSMPNMLGCPSWRWGVNSGAGLLRLRSVINLFVPALTRQQRHSFFWTLAILIASPNVISAFSEPVASLETWPQRCESIVTLPNYAEPPACVNCGCWLHSPPSRRRCRSPLSLLAWCCRWVKLLPPCLRWLLLGNGTLGQRSISASGLWGFSCSSLLTTVSVGYGCIVSLYI